VDTKAILDGFGLAFPGKRVYARTKPVFERELPAEDLLFLDEYRDW